MTTYATAQAKKPSGCAIGEHHLDPDDSDHCLRCHKRGLRAPASLAAEQRPFTVGDHVSGVVSKRSNRTKLVGQRITGKLVNSGALPTIDAGGGGTSVEAVSLRHESPPSAKRPECDACGKPSVVKTRTDLPTSIGTRFPNEDIFLASGSAGSVDAATREDAGASPSGTVARTSTQPVAPGRPSRDPYAEHREKLAARFPALCTAETVDHVVMGVQYGIDQDRRDNMTPKQRQAAEALLRAARPKRFREAPGGWEAWSSPSWESDP